MYDTPSLILFDRGTAYAIDYKNDMLWAKLSKNYGLNMKNLI